MADKTVWKAVEDLFKDNPGSIIAMAQVQECSAGMLQTAKSKKRLPKITDQPRCMVLMGYQDNQAHTVRLQLHLCKPSGMGFEVTRCFRLVNLSRIEVYLGEPGVLHSLQAFELAFAGDKADHVVAFQVQDEETLLRIVAPLWHFQTKFPVAEQKRPSLVTYPGNTVSFVVQMEAWNAKHVDKELEKRLTVPQHGPDDEREAADAEEEGSKMSLVSAKEERDLQALLDKFTIEVHDLADFQNRLQHELSSLEAANVHAILESDAEVASVRDSLNDALALLDDVNENLATFDTKLLVMREDIAAIEARNNRLELQTRNNGKLLNTLDNLLAKLRLPVHVESALKNPYFTQNNLDAMVKAGWDLFDHLEGLSESQNGDGSTEGISSALASMEAVAAQRQRLAFLANLYVKKASHFIGAELNRISDSALPSAPDGGLIESSAPDHSEIQAELDELTSLLHVVRSLQPDAIAALGEQYTKAFNTLLRRELRLYTSTLRKQIAIAAAISPPDIVLTKLSKKDSGLSPAEKAKKTKAIDIRAISEHMLHPGQLEETALQPHDAYEKLLKEWVPFLKDEIKTCVDFLMLKKDTMPSNAPQASVLSLAGYDAEGLTSEKPSLSASNKTLTPVSGSIKAIESMLMDISKEFVAVVEVVGRQKQVQAIAMLATTLRWQVEVGEEALVAPLQDILARCGQRLIQNFEAFLNETVASVNHYEPRGSGIGHGDGLKTVHILPLVTNFSLMLEQLKEYQDAHDPGTGDDSQGKDAEEDDDMLGESLNDTHHHSSDDEAYLIREESLRLGSGGGHNDDDQIRRQLRGHMSPLQRQERQKVLHRENQLLDTADSFNSLSRAIKRPLTEAEIPEHLPELRLITSVMDVVNPVYAILIRAIISAIQRIAALDAKHGTRLSMENFIELEAALRSSTEPSPVLVFFIKVTEGHKEDALQTYVQQQLEYGNFWKLVEFSAAVQGLLSEVGPEEAPYQPGYQMTDLRHLYSTTFHHTEKRLSVLRGRIQRHLSSNPDAIALVWKRLQDRLLSSFESLLEQTDELYPEVQPPLQPPDLIRLLQNTK